jgi:hypothetical protein
MLTTSNEKVKSTPFSHQVDFNFTKTKVDFNLTKKMGRLNNN